MGPIACLQYTRVGECEGWENRLSLTLSFQYPTEFMFLILGA